MRRALQLVVGLAVLSCIGLLLSLGMQSGVYALANRTAEFSFVILDEKTGEPIPGASVELWDEPFEPAQRKRIAGVVTDARGVAKYVRENQSVEDVTGISPTHKLEGVPRHPAGVGTFVDRFWCTLDVAATGYLPLQ